MLNLNQVSPYIRLATHSKLFGPYSISKRIIFDYLIVYIKDGKGTLIYNNKKYKLKTDDVIFIAPNVEHEIIVADGDLLCQPHIHFDITYDELSETIPISFRLENQLSEEEKKYIRPNWFKECKITSPFLHFSDMEKFRRLFFDVVESYSGFSTISILNCKRRFLRLFGYILEENFNKYLPNRHESNFNVLLVKDYIDSNPNKKVSLEFLSEYFHFNPSYLDRRFKQTFGVTVYKYYNNVRNDRATNMLRDSYSITEISNALAFSNVFDFSRFFKRMNGMSPTEYRKKIENEK